MINLHLGDAVQWALDYTGEPFHALLCDAPYEMAFMNKGWDASGVAFDPETWKAFARVLHPGAFLMVCAGTINDDLISVAMREAGLRKFHKMGGWVYGSGFPKATRIDTQIDKRKGGPGITLEVVKYLRKKRDEVGLTNREIDALFGFNGMAGHWTGFSQPEIPRLEYWQQLKKLLGLDERFDDAITAHEREVIGSQTKARSTDSSFAMPTMGADVEYKEWDITAPATDLARAWAGHRYGLQALKPALETVLIFQKPYAGKPVDCITRTGAGALNVDGGRVGVSEEDKKAAAKSTHGATQHIGNKAAWNGEPVEYNPQGRWPANFYTSCDCETIDWCDCEDDDHEAR